VSTGKFNCCTAWLTRCTVSDSLTFTRQRFYRVAHKKRPKFSALEKTHVVSLGRIALAIGQSTVSTILTCHANDVTQDVTEKD